MNKIQFSDIIMLLILGIVMIVALLLVSQCTPSNPTVTPTVIATTKVPVITNTPTKTSTPTKIIITPTKVTPTKIPTKTVKPTVTPKPTFTETPKPTITKDYRWYNCTCQCVVDYPRVQWSKCNR